MADSIERRQNAPAVDAQVATPSIIEGPRMYVGGGQWVPVEMPPLVEKLSKPQKGEVLDSQSFDGVDTGSYTASWGSQNLAGLFAETEERTAVDRAAARLALDESARSRRVEAREIRLGRVARKLHKTPEGLAEMLGEAKAVRWASGASKGKVSATRPDAPERRVIEEQRIDSGQIARLDAWGIEALGPDVENPAEELTPDQFQHLKIEDQVDRMWEAEARGRVEAGGVMERWVFGHITPQEMHFATQPGLTPLPDEEPSQELSEKDRRAMKARQNKFADARLRRIEGAMTVKITEDVKDEIEGVAPGTSLKAIERVIDLDIGLVTVYQTTGAEPVIAPRKDQDPDGENERWGKDPMREREHIQASGGEEQVEDHVGLKRLAARDEQVELSESYPWEAEDGSMVSEGLAVAGERDTRLGSLVDVLDVYGAAFYKEVEIVSAEAYVMQEGIDPDNAERRAQIREARQTLADQELI